MSGSSSPEGSETSFAVFFYQFSILLFSVSLFILVDSIDKIDGLKHIFICKKQCLYRFDNNTIQRNTDNNINNDINKDFNNNFSNNINNTIDSIYNHTNNYIISDLLEPI